MKNNAEHQNHHQNYLEGLSSVDLDDLYIEVESKIDDLTDTLKYIQDERNKRRVRGEKVSFDPHYR